METTLTRREAVVVARKLRQRGYSGRIRAVYLQGRSIREAALHVAGEIEDVRTVAEDIIGVLQVMSACR